MAQVLTKAICDQVIGYSSFGYQAKPAFAKATADEGGLAQLARALALQAKGHRFDSDILHKSICGFADMRMCGLKNSSLNIDVGFGPVDS